MRHFQPIAATEFAALVRDFPWTRRITEVHLHHTWRPRQKDYAGARTIEGMWCVHVETNKWSDIAQHVSVAPDGTIWIGRNFNWSPASASGFNGNSHAGPFMIEMIGDFDAGREVLSPEQKRATLTVIKAVQQKFELKPEQIRFHNEMSSKSCPGTSQHKAQWIEDIAQFQPPELKRDGSRAAFPTQAASNYHVIAGMNPAAEQTDDMSKAEHDTGLAPLDEALGGRDIAARGFDPAVLEELSDHIINLTQGRFSRDGIVRSDEGDVDRILGERMAEEIAGAKARGEKARLLVYAHGGLVSEETALLAAYDQLRFWRANNVYPLFFIWETGFAETLKQMLFGTRSLATVPRGVIRDWLDDRVEDTVRFAGADKIWSAMKRSAELASASKGGATYVGERIGRLLAEHGDDVELHIAGHSAGSIFQAHFLATLEHGVRIETAHFLAPAITRELFLERFEPEIGRKVKSLTLFTMTKVRELADTVTTLYGKSLLYMIYHALEPDRETDLIGLEISLRRDRDLRTLFGLGARGNGKADVVWSPSSGAASGSASNSTRHGDFDNDALTLESVCRRVTGKVNGQSISPYTARRSNRSIWDSEIQWLDNLRPYITPAEPNAATAPAISVQASQPSLPVNGRRRALCFGIDNYKHVTPLADCLNDVKTWNTVLAGLGFEVETIPEQDATATGILDRLRRFISSAQTGDRLVVQYAGHGANFEDRSGDEKNGVGDSAICAIDCGNPSGEGGIVLDDDIYEAIKLVPKGAEITLFYDCCYSGTIMRALGAPPLNSLPGNAKARFVKTTPEMIQAYKKMKVTQKGARTLTGEAGLIGVQFSACQENEVAYEFNGAGHFTSIATKVILQARGNTNRTFHDQLIATFGAGARQTPNLYCDPSAFDRPLGLF